MKAQVGDFIFVGMRFSFKVELHIYSFTRFIYYVCVFVFCSLCCFYRFFFFFSLFILPEFLLIKQRTKFLVYMWFEMETFFFFIWAKRDEKILLLGNNVQAEKKTSTHKPKKKKKTLKIMKEKFIRWTSKTERCSRHYKWYSIPFRSLCVRFFTFFFIFFSYAWREKKTCINARRRCTATVGEE